MPSAWRRIVPGPTICNEHGKNVSEHKLRTQSAFRRLAKGSPSQAQLPLLALPVGEHGQLEVPCFSGWTMSSSKIRMKDERP